jgi:hypothetical protein
MPEQLRARLGDRLAGERAFGALEVVDEPRDGGAAVGDGAFFRLGHLAEGLA